MMSSEVMFIIIMLNYTLYIAIVLLYREYTERRTCPNCVYM